LRQPEKHSRLSNHTLSRRMPSGKRSCWGTGVGGAICLKSPTGRSISLVLRSGGSRQDRDVQM